MRRLTAEEVRDSILAASGKLNLKAGGPSVYPQLPTEVLAGISFTNKKEHWPDSPPEEANRRSVYVFVKRSLQVPVLDAHDQADTDSRARSGTRRRCRRRRWGCSTATSPTSRPRRSRTGWRRSTPATCRSRWRGRSG